jgi:hypothetical protein
VVIIQTVVIIRMVVIIQAVSIGVDGHLGLYMEAQPWDRIIITLIILNYDSPYYAPPVVVNQEPLVYICSTGPIIIATSDGENFCLSPQRPKQRAEGERSL